MINSHRTLFRVWLQYIDSEHQQLKHFDELEEVHQLPPSAIKAVLGVMMRRLGVSGHETMSSTTYLQDNNTDVLHRIAKLFSPRDEKSREFPIPKTDRLARPKSHRAMGVQELPRRKTTSRTVRHCSTLAHPLPPSMICYRRHTQWKTRPSGALGNGRSGR